MAVGDGKCFEIKIKNIHHNSTEYQPIIIYLQHSSGIFVVISCSKDQWICPGRFTLTVAECISSATAIVVNRNVPISAGQRRISEFLVGLKLIAVVIAILNYRAS